MSSTDAELSAKDKKSVVDITVEHIMGRVNRKERKPSTKTPTESELVETLKASRNSMREAIKILIALGLLEIRRTDGIYVVNHFSEKMMTPWICSLLLKDDDPLALLEPRMVTEWGAFPLAIQKDTEGDMHTIYGASEYFIVLAQDVQATFPEILDADIRYRERICGAPHNHPTARLNDMIAFISLHSREKPIREATACGDRFHTINPRRKLAEIIVQQYTVDLNEVPNYRYKCQGITLQSQKWKSGRSAV